MWLAAIPIAFSLWLPLLWARPPARGNPILAPTTPTPDVTALQERISSILDAEHVPGAGIALTTRDGVVWAGGVGLADVATGRKVDANTPFRLGSVTKNVTALAIMQQVEQGRLALDTRLHDAAPEVPFENPWESTNPVTIAHLLEHTAGFDLYRFNDDVDTGPAPRPLLAALAVNPAARQSRWPPGTRAAYSNEGFTTAGYVLEKVTGRSFDDLVHDEVFAPLGMHDSAFLRTADLQPRLALGYDDPQHEAIYVEDMQRPAANLISSADDMSRYLMFWLRAGEVDGRSLLSSSSIVRMQTRITLPFVGPEAQYGLGTDTAQFGQLVAHGHTGIQLGFQASLRYFPGEGFGWAIMLNAQNDQALTDIEAELLAFLSNGVAAAPPTAATASETWMGIAGDYRDAAPTQEIFAALNDVFGSTQIQVRQDGVWERTQVVGGLRSLITQAPFHKLVPAEPQGAFRLEGESISSRLFTRTADGQDVLVTQLGYWVKTPAWLTAAKRAVILGALMFMESAVILLPLGILQTLASTAWTTGNGLLRLPGPTGWIPPLLLALVAPAAWLVLSRSPEPLGIPNLSSVLILIFSTAFPVLTVLTIIGTIRTVTDIETGVFARAYMLLLAAAGSVLSVFAWYAHWVGLRTWSW
ncbi:MAG: beta-lactamase family protein [Chloroflexota bacterium]|nr:beta-lactamase family protein [Chloroflexota bacterium]